MKIILKWIKLWKKFLVHNKIDRNYKNISFKVSNILKDDGVFISITFAQPHFRKPLYAKDEYKWSIELQTIGETFHYFIYIMKKGRVLNPDDKKIIFTKSDNNFNFLLNFDFDEDYLFKIEENIF